MEFDERLAALASKVHSHRDAIHTEEAAKTAFVLPFIANVLGYDVFDPTEVVPEYTADVGIKRGEKVDYAILRDGEVKMLIECKKANTKLTAEHASQLFRYFTVSHSRIAVLTNGQVYQFYTDLETPNRMDSKPFMVFDLADVDQTLVPELRKLTKEAFDLDSVISTAEELKYLGQIKRLFVEQFANPESDWVRFFVNRVYDGAFTQRVREQFTPLVAKAASQYLNDQVNTRLKTALSSSFPDSSPDNATDEAVDDVREDQDESPGDDIETTLEELEGYQIVKAIACSEVKPQRIAHRDAKSYFAILLDDNNRKPIARLRFNARSKKYLGVFDADKNETRHLLESLDDIYLHANAIREAAKRYPQ